MQLLLKMKVDFKRVTSQDYKAGCPPVDCAISNDHKEAVDGDDQVDPWNVSTTSAKGVDYEKLIGRL